MQRAEKKIDAKANKTKKKGAARPTGAEWKETGGGAVVFFAFSISPAFNFSIDVNERFVVTSQYRAFCVRRDLSCRDFFSKFFVLFFVSNANSCFFFAGRKPSAGLGRQRQAGRLALFVLWQKFWSYFENIKNNHSTKRFSWELK